MILMFLFDIVLILFNANIGIKTSIDIAINYAFFMWSTSEEYGNIYIYTHKYTKLQEKTLKIKILKAFKRLNAYTYVLRD